MSKEGATKKGTISSPPTRRGTWPSSGPPAWDRRRGTGPAKARDKETTRNSAGGHASWLPQHPHNSQHAEPAGPAGPAAAARWPARRPAPHPPLPATPTAASGAARLHAALAR